MARLSFRCDDNLVARVDAARGDIARERWLRGAIEREVLRAQMDAVNDELEREPYEPTEDRPFAEQVAERYFGPESESEQ